MCVLCGPAANGAGIASRGQALALLARLERPGALAPAEAVHLAMRLLAWSEREAARLACDDGVAADPLAERHHTAARAA